VLLEACAFTNRSSPYSECLGCSQYVTVLPETPHENVFPDVQRESPVIQFVPILSEKFQGGLHTVSLKEIIQTIATASGLKHE